MFFISLFFSSADNLNDDTSHISYVDYLKSAPADKWTSGFSTAATSAAAFKIENKKPRKRIVLPRIHMCCAVDFIR